MTGFCFFLKKYIYICTAPLTKLVVFTNGPGAWGSIPGRVIPMTQKMVLDASLLNTQHYKVRIKGKVKQSKEIELCPSPTTWCSSYWKGSLQLWSPTLLICTFVYIYIYIYIYLKFIQWIKWILQLEFGKGSTIYICSLSRKSIVMDPFMSQKTVTMTCVRNFFYTGKSVYYPSTNCLKSFIGSSSKCQTNI